MGAYEELIERLRQTDVMQQVLAALEKEPVTLLYAICKEYEASNEPVPDQKSGTRHFEAIAMT